MGKIIIGKIIMGKIIMGKNNNGVVVSSGYEREGVLYLPVNKVGYGYYSYHCKLHLSTGLPHFSNGISGTMQYFTPYLEVIKRMQPRRNFRCILVFVGFIINLVIIYLYF